MRVKIFVLFFILLFSYIKAQFASTIFIDTLDIIVNNEKMYSLKATTLKFIPHDSDTKITLYNNGNYKLVKKFNLNKSTGYSSIISSGVNFFQNDTVYPLSHIIRGYDFEECTEEIRVSEYFQNWYDTIIPVKKTQIKLFYRLLNFAPLDTTNYKFNYKEGLWVGEYAGADRVTINYKQNKKHGLASVFYKDSTSFNVNFNYGIADYYGRGYGERLGKSKKLKFSYIRPFIVTRSCDTINESRHESFYFTRNKKAREIVSYNDLSVHSQKKGLYNDSIEYSVRGDFIGIINDSMVIRTDEIEVHDFYKINTDSLHSYSKKPLDGFAKISVKDISKIYYARDEWKTFTLRASLLSFATALIVSPLISIQKGGFNGNRFSKVSGVSCGVMILSISFGIAFSQKEYLILPTKKNLKTWKIIPKHYE
jgi:hypothetical protein